MQGYRADSPRERAVNNVCSRGEAALRPGAEPRSALRVWNHYGDGGAQSLAVSNSAVLELVNVRYRWHQKDKSRRVSGMPNSGLLKVRFMYDDGT